MAKTTTQKKEQLKELIKELKENNKEIKLLRKQLSGATKVTKVVEKVGNNKLKIKEELLKKNSPEQTEWLIKNYQTYFEITEWD